MFDRAFLSKSYRLEVLFDHPTPQKDNAQALHIKGVGQLTFTSQDLTFVWVTAS
jgi:hypothetical protein